MTLFSYREQVASGCHLCRSHRSRRSVQPVDRCSDRPGRPDLDQSDGLEEGHNFTCEGGMVLMPPSPAVASVRFRTRVPPSPFALRVLQWKHTVCTGHASWPCGLLFSGAFDGVRSSSISATDDLVFR